MPEYATKSFNMDIGQAGKLVSDFWTSYMVGMWVFSFILRASSICNASSPCWLALATGAMYLFVSTDNPEHLGYYIMALGFVSSAIYTTLITLGSLQVSSPKLVNFILTCGTIGTMLTFVVTGPIVAKGGARSALTTANGLYLAVFVMSAAGLVTKHRSHGHVTH